MDAANGILSREGYLVLNEDPDLWIQRNPSHRLSVRRLKLDYSMRGGKRKIGDSIGEFKELTHLSIHDKLAVTHLPDNLPSLRKLKVLDLYGCYHLLKLPRKLGDLYTLTSLSLRGCNSIKSLPGSLGKLSNLTDLSISICYKLEELPANFGNLKSLTHFKLVHCIRIKLLPKLPNKLTNLTIESCEALEGFPENMGELKSLTHVFIDDCRSLRDCPSNMKLVDLNIKDCCSIQALPRGLSNLKHLCLPLCINREEERLANLKYCVNLRHLKFWDCFSHNPKEFPLNVDKLPQLSLLDIQDTRIKWLPSSISKLSKLRLLLLPYGFLLDTLPYDLDESLVISVKHTHVRKTWKELKTELEIFSFHTVGVDPSGYLSLTGDPAPWIQNNSTSLSMVRILDLDLRGNRAENITDSIAELAELTHLVISGGSLRQLPQTFTRISHISLLECEFECNMKSVFDSLGKLSTLKYLDLFDIRLPEHVDFPVSLRHLSLGSSRITFTPLLDSMTKLSNLKALHLFRFGLFDFLPKKWNLEKLELVDCYMTDTESPPRGLRHLEILHCKGMCSPKCNVLGSWFNQLVDVETLSVTCHHIKLLPSVAGLHNVKELQLKDCFSIKQLPQDLDVMVNLCTLNLSGTRIKSLPHSISKLPKLQCLILPKCFQPGSLPLEFRNQSLVSFDNTDDKYYEDMGYYDTGHETSDEADDNTTNTLEVVDEVISKESDEGITSQQQISSHQLLDQPDATPISNDSNFNGRNNLIGKNDHRAINRSQNQERITDDNSSCDKTDVSHSGNSLNSLEENKKLKKPRGKRREFTMELIRSLVDKGMTVAEAGEELGVSSSTLKRRCRDLGIREWPSSRQHSINMTKVSSSLPSMREDAQFNVGGDVRLKSLIPQKIVVNDSTSDEAIRAQFNVSSTVPSMHEDAQFNVDGDVRFKSMKPRKIVVVNDSTPDETIRAQKEPPMTSQRSHQVQEHLNGDKECVSSITTEQPEASRSNFIVKARNDENGDIVRFQFSLSSNIDQLKDEIGRRLELEVGKFKIRYKDADDDWVLVTCISDLKHALSLSKSDYVRLSVVLKTFQC